MDPDSYGENLLRVEKEYKRMEMKFMITSIISFFANQDFIKYNIKYCISNSYIFND